MMVKNKQILFIFRVVGTRGIEPLTPTMSRGTRGQPLGEKNQESKGLMRIFILRTAVNWRRTQYEHQQGVGQRLTNPISV